MLTKFKNQLVMEDWSFQGLFDDEDIDKVIASLETKPLVNSLNLRGNMITEKVVQRLFELKQLKAIDLGENALRDKGVKLFVSLFEKKQTNIVVIDVSENGLTDTGIKELMKIKREMLEIEIGRCDIEIENGSMTEKCLAEFSGDNKSRRPTKVEIISDRTTHIYPSTLVTLFTAKKKSSSLQIICNEKNNEGEKTLFNKASLVENH
jgi:hypothetical protein